MNVAIYSPDRHFVYDGRTLESQGIGGGLTARIRIAIALARRGHSVTVFCNCQERTQSRGVAYIPLDGVTRIRCDALILHSSGGEFDLSPILSVAVEAKVRVIAVSGVELPKAAEQLSPDAVYACSNFARRMLMRYPYLTSRQIFVTHYGVNSWNRPGLLSPARDPYRLMYSSHPSKGLNAALEVLRFLRHTDPRFTLSCFGGNQLWGGPDSPPPPEPGFSYHGSISQRDLAKAYQRSSFLLQLQNREEPFGITVVEGMAAGCIVLASNVGAFSETLRHGANGYLLNGDSNDSATIERAGRIVLEFQDTNAHYARRVRQAAMATPFDWDTIAEVWEAHLLRLLSPSRPVSTPAASWARCSDCGSTTFLLADGFHCPECGYFDRTAQPESLGSSTV